MSGFNANDYGPALAAAIDEEPLAPLDAGRLSSHARDKLRGMSVESAFAHSEVVDRPMAECCLAGVWLLHNGLDEAHTLCQDVPTPTGAYWHGVVHRREGDDGNAKYWFHRAGDHPATTGLAEGSWDAAAFVDRCRRARDGGDPTLLETCLAEQRAEWRVLFDWCYRAATGSV